MTCAAMSALTGCHVVDVSEKTRLEHDGESLHRAQLESLVPGKTRRQDVLEVLGPPDTETLEDQIITYTYFYDQQKHRRVSLILLFRYSAQHTDTHSFHISFLDDVVQSAWYDNNSPDTVIEQIP